MTSAQKRPKWRLVIAMAALFVSSMCTLGDLVITPITADLFTVFAGSSEALINFSITGPALVGLPFGLLAGWLCDRFDKKWVMVAGFAIFTFSAIFGAAVENIWYFVVMRCLATGVGWGVTNTAAFAILADLFTDEGMHGKMVGWYNAVMSIMGAILSAVGGAMAASGTWQDAFLIYWIAAPVLVLLVVFLPSMKPKTAASSEAGTSSDASKAGDKGWWKKVLPLNIQVFVVAICYFVAMYMIALYIEDAGIGDEAFIGVVASCMTLATAVSSLFFGKLYEKMKTAVYFPFVAAIGLAFILMGFVVTPVMAVIGAIVMGFSWTFYFCYFYAHCTELVPENRSGASTSLVAFSDGLAATGSSYLLTGLIGATGMTAVGVWPIFGVILLVTLAISMVSYFVKRGKKSVG